MLKKGFERRSTDLQRRSMAFNGVRLGIKKPGFGVPVKIEKRWI
jgi:hypothetical protein